MVIPEELSGLCSVESMIDDKFKEVKKCGESHHEQSESSTYIKNDTNLADIWSDLRPYLFKSSVIGRKKLKNSGPGRFRRKNASRSGSVSRAYTSFDRIGRNRICNR
jgi:hypothetical protein